MTAETEAKTKFEAMIDRFTEEATRNGLLIEAGFLGLRKMAIARHASPEQIEDMRLAFFAGAQHLFASMMRMLDPGEDPTDADLGRMDAIDRELQRFAEQFAQKHLKTKGSA
jgi:hypothetical protein